MNGYRTLAEHRRTTVLGEGEEGGGFNLTSIIPGIFNAAGQGVSAIVNWDAKKKASEKAEKSSREALETSKAADVKAKNAIAKALVSAEMKSGSAEADKIAADSALAAADEAAQGLSPENQKARAKAAKDALDRAVAEWQAASAGKDTGTTKVKEFYVQAAKQVYGKTQNAMLVRAAEMPGGVTEMQKVPASEGWLSRKVLGPIPGWGVLVGLAGFGTVTAIALKRGR